MKATPRYPLAVMVVWALLAGVGGAQIPEKFTNLQVLPKDTPRAELVPTMRSYASALGVRCVHCHAGKDTPNLEGVDFASDERETKRAAREMMKMVQAINRDHMPRLQRPTQARVECATCHHGVARPRTLAAEVSEALEKGGAEGAVARYRELRGTYYGRGGYDFGQGTLNGLGETLVRAGRAREAIALLALNAEFFPDAGWTHYLLGEAYRGSGEMDKARASYERSAVLEPGNPMARQRLTEMAQPSPKP